MANQLEQELRSLIGEFTGKLATTVRRSVLEQVVAAMGGDIPIPYSLKTKRGPGRPRGSGRPARAARAGGKRSSEQVAAMGENLLAHVKSKPGQRAEQIAAALRSDVKTIRLPMQQLLAAKKVRTKGQRRGTTYFAA